MRWKHGHYDKPIYNVWRIMRQRCRNTNDKNYHHYGGRGITVCKRWDSFNSFWEDMGSTYQEGLTLDRIDNDGPYNPNNCRWVSRSIQSRNSRRNIKIETPWGVMIIADAADKVGVKRSTVYSRVKAGWPVDKLLIQSDRSNKVHKYGIRKEDRTRQCSDGGT